jgi:hypothetical protein
MEVLPMLETLPAPVLPRVCLCFVAGREHTMADLDQEHVQWILQDQPAQCAGGAQLTLKSLFQARCSIKNVLCATTSINPLLQGGSPA